MCHACTASGQACQPRNSAALTIPASRLKLDDKASRESLPGSPRKVGRSRAPRTQTDRPSVNSAKAPPAPAAPLTRLQRSRVVRAPGARIAQRQETATLPPAPTKPHAQPQLLPPDLQPPPAHFCLLTCAASGAAKNAPPGKPARAPPPPAAPPPQTPAHPPHTPVPSPDRTRRSPAPAPPVTSS